jgi:RHS repeat-associated protein
MMADEAGALAWKAQLDVYGVAQTDVALTGCPWRWPGQYEDEETGLYYNRFRYYDPASGRYVNQDPIGLGGGLELYGYVFDPIDLVDPYGLAGCRNGQPLPTLERGNPKVGWDHIFARHVPGFGSPQGDLFKFRPGRTVAEMEALLTKGMEEVWSKGARASDPGKAVQTFEKQVKIDGVRARCALVVDAINNRVVSFFPALGGS